MIKLSNGAKVHTAALFNYNTSRCSGLVLAETATDFVTWNIWLDARGTDGSEAWEADTGHYFYIGSDPGKARQEAEIDFGERLAFVLPANAYTGLKSRCEA